MTDAPFETTSHSAEVGINATRAYSADRCPIDILPLALFLLLLALVPFAVDGARGKQIMSGIILLLASVGMIGHMLYRRVHPSAPMYVLSPAGLTLNLSKRTHVLIPWGTITHIGTADPKFFYPSLVRPRTIRFRDVTTVVVPRTFYDARIHVESRVMRGPAWNLNFLHKGETVEIAIHHEAIGEPKEILRHEIEARWQAFRHQTTITPTSGVPKISQRPEPRPKPCSLENAKWTSLAAIGVLAPAIIVVFTNLIGAWETDSQRKSREVREVWLKKTEADHRKAAEDRRRQDEAWKKMWRDF